MLTLILSFSVIAKSYLTKASLTCSTAYDDKTLISALNSRISTLEYSHASLEETSIAKFTNLEKNLDQISKQQEKFYETGPFENLEGWSKIDSDVSNNLYYMLMDFHGGVDFLGAQVICKEFRNDAYLAEVHSLKEMEGLKKLAAGRNKHYWMNAYNGKPAANKLIDYIWLNSGKIVNPSLWLPGGEGTDNAAERVFAFHSNGNGFFDVSTSYKYYAACELRS